jgi:hypothetical protein
MSANMDILTVSLPVCIPFISYSCLVALARNSRTMLNRGGKSGHLVLFLSLGEMVSVFPINYDVGYRVVIYSLIILRYISSIPSFF